MKRNKKYILPIIFFVVCTFFAYNVKASLCGSAERSASSYCNDETHICYRCTYDYHSVKGDLYQCVAKNSAPPTTGTVRIYNASVKVSLSCVSTQYGVYQKQVDEALKKQSVLEGCGSFEEARAELSDNCLLCPVFHVALVANQRMATISYGALAAGFRNVIIIVLALFIAYHTFLSVSAFTKQDVGKYLHTIAVQAFKVLLAALLLSNADYIYHYVINPLMEAGLEFGLKIINDAALEQLEKYTSLAESSMPTGVISQRLLAQVYGTVQLFTLSSMEMPLIGGKLICVASHSMANILPDMAVLLEGSIIWAFGWAIALACCFYLLDSAVRLGIFCTLLPFLIACWPFKITFTYTKKGFDIFMNALFNFVMMGLIISLTQQLTTQALTGGQGNADDIEQAMTNNDMDKLKELLDLSGVKFLVLLACCIFAFKLVSQVGELANNVSGTSGPTAKTSIGGKLGGLATQAATNAALGSKDSEGHRKGGLLGGAAKVTGLKGLADKASDKMGAISDTVRHKIGGS